MAVAGANGPSRGGAHGSVWIGVLGPFEVRVDGAMVNLPRGALRQLLALLTYEPGRVVRDNVLIDRLWGEFPPKSVLFSLRNLVARLRSILGAESVERTADGYRLNTAVVTTDLQEFSALVEEAVALARQDVSTAVGYLDQALALVRGRAFVDGVEDHEALVVTMRVEEQICAAEEQRGALRLVLGRVGSDLARFHDAVEQQALGGSAPVTRWTPDVTLLEGQRAT